MEDPDQVSDWEGHQVAAEVSERVREVIGAAEAAASAIRHEAEEQGQARRRAADDEARHLIEDARREAEALLAERMRRISELSDSIIERGEALLARVDRAEEVRSEFETLVDALGASAAQLARDATTELGAVGGDQGRSTATSAAQGTGEESAQTPTQEQSVPGPPPVRSQAAEAPARKAPVGDGAAEAPTHEAVDAEARIRETPAAEDAAEAPTREVSTAEMRPSERVAEPDERSSEDAAPAEPATAEPAAWEQAAGPSDEETIEDAVVVEAEDESTADLHDVGSAESDVEPDGDDQLLGARLVALQMAVAGGNRGEVEAHLRRAFELPDPQSILDDVFGPGTDATKRVVWPSAADA